MKDIQTIFSWIALVIFLLVNPRAHSQPLPIRGFMIDAPRTTESLKYYFDIIDFCKANDLNTIIFRLTDDEGSAYKFSSHPDLLMCRGAYSVAEIKQIIQYSQQKGIEIIPEIEAFGHAKYITASPRYKNLNDAVGENEFNALCPVNDSSLALMKDLFVEVASIFPSKYLHIGCDETNWGGSALSKTALLTKSKNQIWAAYVNRLNDYVRALGKETIIWGDLPIYNENAVLDLLDKKIIIADWNYWENDTVVVAAFAQKVLAKGFRLIGSPAISWCKWGARVGAMQFKNIAAYTQVYSNLKNPNNLGFVLTNWVPQKYLQYSQWDFFVFAAAIARHCGKYDYMTAIPAFIENTFGIKYDSTWSGMYKTLYNYSPQFSCADTDSMKFFPWASEAQLQFLADKNRIVENPFGVVKKLLLGYKNKIRKNKNIFNDLFTTVDFLDYLYKRESDVVTFMHSGTKDLKKISKYFKLVAASDSIYKAKMKIAWSKGRRAMIDEYDKDFMYSFAKAADFSKHMSEHPTVCWRY